jgi:hypothetical protein
LRLHRDTITGLTHYKGEHGLTSWDAVIAHLLARQRVSGP